MSIFSHRIEIMEFLKERSNDAVHLSRPATPILETGGFTGETIFLIKEADR